MGALPPELKILILNATALAVAYLGIYPSMERITLRRLVRNDLIITALVMTAAAAMFAGAGVRFSMILFDTTWWVFTLVTAMAMEWPLFMRLCRRQGIDPFADDAWDDET